MAVRRQGTPQQLPEQWPVGIGKKPPEDGSELALHHRTLEFDRLEQCVTREMRMLLWQDGQCTADEAYTLTDNLYFRNELQRMLEEIGFKIEAVQSGYSDKEATVEDDVIVFIARK